eukprot:7087601-Prymnesium_polylepis.1
MRSRSRPATEPAAAPVLPLRLGSVGRPSLHPSGAVTDRARAVAAPAPSSMDARDMEIEEYLASAHESSGRGRHQQRAAAAPQRGCGSLPAISPRFGASAVPTPASHWSADDDEQLIALVTKYPRRWGVVGMHLNRASRDCRLRWQIIAEGSP